MNDYSKIDPMFSSNNITLLFSKELLDEFVTVAQRPKFKKYFSHKDIEELLIRIRLKAVFVSVITTIDICRDPNDNFLLALANDGAATHLITGDNDLLVLGNIGKTKILTMTDFINKK